MLFSRGRMDNVAQFVLRVVLNHWVHMAAIVRGKERLLLKELKCLTLGILAKSRKRSGRVNRLEKLESLNGRFSELTEGSRGRIENFAQFVFRVVLNHWVHMAAMDRGKERLLLKELKCLTLGILAKARKRSGRVDHVEKLESLNGRFSELTEDEVSLVTLSYPQLKIDYHIPLNLNSKVLSHHQVVVGNLNVELIPLAGAVQSKYGFDGGQTYLCEEVSTSNVLLEAPQSLDTSIQNAGSETFRPLYVLPDCSVFWKSEQDSINLYDPLSDCTHVWKPMQTEEFGDLWQGCMYPDVQKTSDQDRWNCKMGKGNLENYQDSDSGSGDSESMSEASSPVNTEKDCGIRILEIVSEDSLSSQIEEDRGLHVYESLFEDSWTVPTEGVSGTYPFENSWPVVTENVSGISPSEDSRPVATERGLSPFVVSWPVLIKDYGIGLSADSSPAPTEKDCGICLSADSSPIPAEEDCGICLSADSSPAPSEEDCDICLSADSSPAPSEEDCDICLSADSSPAPSEEDCDICLSADSSPAPSEEDCGICLSSDSSPVQTEKVCGICLYPVGKSKFSNRRPYGLLNNCEHIFCYPCLGGFCKPIFEPSLISASCPECGMESEAVAASVFWMEGMEKRIFFNDLLFEALIAPERLPLVNSTGVRFQDQLEEDKAVIRFEHSQLIASFWKEI